MNMRQKRRKTNIKHLSAIKSVPSWFFGVAEIARAEDFLTKTQEAFLAAAKFFKNPLDSAC